MAYLDEKLKGKDGLHRWLFFYWPFFEFWYDKKFRKTKSLLLPLCTFLSDSNFSVQSHPNLFVFEPNIKIRTWDCFPLIFFFWFQFWSQKWSKLNKQKSYFLTLEFAFVQIGQVSSFGHVYKRYIEIQLWNKMFCFLIFANYFHPNVKLFSNWFMCIFSAEFEPLISILEPKIT